MKKQDYTTQISSPVSADETFKQINKVEGWWTKNLEGRTDRTGDVFTVRFGETFITITVIELVPGKSIQWKVTDCYKHWLADKKEWLGTQINWQITQLAGATQISFTHLGLVPGIECYNGCEKAWNFYLEESLNKLLATGKGAPDPLQKVVH